MSGSKVMQARLDERLQRAVARQVDHSRRLAAEAAQAAAFEGRLVAMMDDIDGCLADDRLAPAFRMKLDSFRARALRLGDAGRRIHEVFDAIAQAGASAQADLPEVSRLRAEADRLAGERQAMLPDLERQVDDIEAGIDAERRRLAFQTARADRRLRQELAGLREEWRNRVHPAAACSLAGVPGAPRLGHRLDALLGADGLVRESDVRSCRDEFAALVAEAEAIEGRRQAQRAIFDGLDRALREAGFEMVLQPLWQADAIRARHASNQPANRGLVDSEVGHDGEIRVEMRGPSGEGIAMLGPSERCGDQVLAVIDLARQFGVIIEHVLWKGPDGWRAMTPEAEHREDRTTMQHDRTMEEES